MTTSTIVTVNIGRHRSGIEMPESLWLDFQQQVEMLLAETVGKSSFALTGDCESHWQGESEQSASFSVLDADISPEPLDVLHYGLSNLAGTFGQEAIALVVGTSELVSVSTSEGPDGETRYFNGPDYLSANCQHGR